MIANESGGSVQLHHRRRALAATLVLAAASTLATAAMCAVAALAQPPENVGRPGRALQHGTIDFSVLGADLKGRALTTQPRAVPAPLPPPMNAGPRSLSPATGTAAAEASAPVTPLSPPPPASSFLGLVDNGTVIPPDTQGAVGPNHLMVTLNSQVRVQTRAGGTVSTVSLDSFWSGVPGAYDVFDPKAVYDPYADRWIVVSAANREAADSSIAVAVSQTGNPAGAWNEYLIDGDAADLTWVDFPTLGFNKDWIVVQANMFSMSDTFVRAHIFVIDKADLYAGGSGNFTLLQSSKFTLSPATTFDSTLASLYLVTTNIPAQGSLQVFRIDGPVGSETLNLAGVASSLADPWFPISGGDFAPQLGSAQKIDVGDHRILGVVYRNGFLWVAHTVLLPSTPPINRSSVQWWQITPAGDVIQHGRIDDPTGNRFFAYPSIAVNARNDVLVGYSSFAATQYASASYSFRASTDPPSTMRDEVILKAGENSYYKTYGGDRNRWGDYSSTAVDPVNDSDMWTLQEYARAAANTWAAWWGRIAVPCGNGNVDPGEECDDANLINADGCDVNCTVTACGNNVLTTATGEQCDDGNLVSGDGCDANCIPTCGNGTIDAGEQCDDSNTVSGDGCDANCTPTGCGNGVITGGEECDDGNSVNGDGCDSNCRESGCGSGVVSYPEECDDGNQLDGDLCPSDCLYSSGALIRGNRRNPSRRTRACQIEWYVVNPTNPLDRFGLASSRQLCMDQDSSCDANPQPGTCDFQVVACVNTTDANLADCMPTGVSSLSLRLPAPSTSQVPALQTVLAADRAAIENALQHLRDPENPDAGFVYAPPSIAGDVNFCSAPFNVTVPTLGRSQRRVAIQTRSLAASGSTVRSVSTLRLTCRVP